MTGGGALRENPRTSIYPSIRPPTHPPTPGDSRRVRAVPTLPTEQRDEQHVGRSEAAAHEEVARLARALGFELRAHTGHGAVELQPRGQQRVAHGAEGLLLAERLQLAVDPEATRVGLRHQELHERVVHRAVPRAGARHQEAGVFTNVLAHAVTEPAVDGRRLDEREVTLGVPHEEGRDFAHRVVGARLVRLRSRHRMLIAKAGFRRKSVAELLEHPNVAEGPEARCAYQREGWERGAARFPLHHRSQRLFQRRQHGRMRA